MPKVSKVGKHRVEIAVPTKQEIQRMMDKKEKIKSKKTSMIRESLFTVLINTNKRVLDPEEESSKVLIMKLQKLAKTLFEDETVLSRIAFQVDDRSDDWEIIEIKSQSTIEIGSDDAKSKNCLHLHAVIKLVHSREDRPSKVHLDPRFIENVTRGYIGYSEGKTPFVSIKGAGTNRDAKRYIGKYLEEHDSDSD